MTLRSPVLIALSDLGHLALYQLMADAETEPGAQREQPSSLPDELASGS